MTTERLSSRLYMAAGIIEKIKEHWSKQQRYVYNGGAYRSLAGPVRTTLRVLGVPGGGGTRMSLKRRHGIGCGVYLLFRHHLPD